MKKWEKYSKEELQRFCDESYSYRTLATKIGYNPDGGSGSQIVKEMIEQLGLDCSHFTGQSWNKGKTQKDDNRIISMEKYNLEDIFVVNSPVSHKVMRGYVERHNLVPYICDECGNIGEWHGQKLKLQIHHKNGDNKDNRLENLCYLCPNCHSITDTYAGRNKGK